MKTMQSIKSCVMRHGSGGGQEVAQVTVRDVNESRTLKPFRLVSGILLTVAMSSPLLTFAVDLSKTPSDLETKAEVKAIAWTNGEIKSIDPEMGKLTIKHGPLINLHMPAMTMLFKVDKASLCDGLKVGDKVRFAAESIHGTLVITALTKQL